MMKDHNHDLVDALAKKNDAVWRYKNHYLPASKECEHCQALWKKLEADDEKHVQALKEEIKRHLDEGKFD